MNTELNFKFIPEDPEPTPGTEPFGRARRSFWSRPLTRLGIILLILGLLALGIISALGVGRLITGVGQAKTALESASAAVTVFDFSGARTSLDEASAGLDGAESGLRLLSWSHPLPFVGDQVQAVAAVVAAGSESVEALREVVDIAEDIYEVVTKAQSLLDIKKTGERVESFADLSADAKSDLLRTLHNSFPELKEVQIKLRLAQDDLDRLDDLQVAPQITEAIAPFQELLPDLIAGVDVLVPLAASVEEVAGVDADRQWLILFENNSELRPGGGFLGVFGLLLMRDGEIKNLLVSDTYAIDQLVEVPEYTAIAPAPLTEYLGVSKWYFRDANWSPDFPTSAQAAAQLLRQEVSFLGQPVPEIHGVLGFTPTLASRLINLTGPITIDGITFNSDNIRDLLEYEVEYGFKEKDIPFDERKAIVSELSNELIDRLMNLPTTKWTDLFAVILDSFADKQIHLYSFDESTQSAFVDAGWSGAIDVGTSDDQLLVVDANLAALKTDPVVERTINYSIAPNDQGYQATTAITYKNTGTFTMFTTRYRTYTRVYAPLHSQLISVSGQTSGDGADVADDLGLTSFGAFISIEPGAEGTLTFTYQLPAQVATAIENDVYQLLVFKQLGADDHALTLDLNFGKKVRTALPAEESSEFGDNLLRLNAVLDADSLFTVQF